MKSSKIFITATICIGSLLFASCKKFLDQEPISNPAEVNYWKTASDAESGVAGCYALLRTALNNKTIAYYAYGDLPTDQFSAVGSEDGQDISNLNLSIGVPASADYRPMYGLRRWDNFYRAIDQASSSIRNIPKIDFTTGQNGATKNSLIGEAYFVRAFSYFYISRVWGDVPLVTTEVAAENAVNLPRASKEAVMAQCISDLKAAIPLLQYGYSSTTNRAIRANRGAAWALLAHIYAWQQNYTECLAATDSVITRGQYSLVNRASNYLSIYKGQSTEGIFEISMNAQNEGAINGIARYTTKAPYNTTNNGNALYTLNTTTLNELYSDTTDLRRKNSFAFLGTTDPICIKYANFQYSTQNNIVIPIAYNNIIVFRLADIKLLQAEALAALNRFTEAKAPLNEIRNAAGLLAYDGTDDNLFKAIIDERGRELFLEGHRYYDLVRLAKVKQIYAFGGTRMSESQFLRGKYYWPVDPTLIALNSLITQTPFWASSM